MQVLDRRTGKYFEAPDHGTDDDILSAYSASGMETIQPPSLAQSFIQAGAPAVGTLAQSLAQGPQRSTLPNIGGAGMIGLSPQQAQFVLQSAQQSNVDAQTQKLRQQELTQQSIEGEKNRSQEIKLYQQRIKNDMAIAKAQAEVDKFEAELRAKGKDADNAMRLQLEEMRNQAAYLRDQAKLYSVGGSLVDSQGQVVFEGKSKSGGIDPNKIIGRDTILMADPNTGENVPVRVNIFANGDYSVIGPAATGTGGTSRNGQSGGPDIGDQLAIQRHAFEKAQATADAAAAAGISPKDHYDNTRRQTRREAGLSAFQTDEEANENIRAETQKLLPQVGDPKWAQALAEVKRWELDGIPAKIDKDGNVVLQGKVSQNQGIGTYIPTGIE